MRTFSTNISALALGAVLSTSLVLSGCGDKNKSKSTSAEVKFEKLADRKVDEAQASQALTALSLNESGSGVFSWADKSGSSGNYTFNEVVIKGDDGDDPVKVGKLELTGAHMVGEKVAFDRIVFNDMTTVDDDANVSVKRIELLKPSPDLSGEIARAFSGDDEAFENFEGDISIGGFDMTGLNITGDDDGTVTMDKLMFGEAKDKTGMFTMKNLNMDVKDKERVQMNLGSIDVVGFNIDKYKGFIAESMKAESAAGGKDIGEEAMKKLMASFNPYAPDYKSISIKDFNADIDGLKIDMASADANATTKGGKTTIVQKSSPITISPPVQPSDRGMKEFADALTEMGYEKLVFRTSQESVLDENTDSMSVKDATFEMDDGFKLSYNYSLSGVKEMMDKAAMMEAGGSGPSAMAAMEMMNSMKFANMKVSLADNSIVDRGFKLAASKQGGNAESLKMQAKAGLAFLPMMAKDPAQQTLAMEASKALGEFLENSGTLILEMNPTEPVLLGNIANSAQKGDFDVSTLGLSIRTE